MLATNELYDVKRLNEESVRIYRASTSADTIAARAVATKIEGGVELP